MAKWSMIPSAEGPFKGLDVMARYCFGLLYDRYKLSEHTRENGSDRFVTERTKRWCDFHPVHFAGDETLVTRPDTYCIYTQPELAKAMGCTERTVRRCIKELREAGLIETERGGYNGANRFFFTYAVYDYFIRQEMIKEYNRKKLP